MTGVVVVCVWTADLIRLIEPSFSTDAVTLTIPAAFISKASCSEAADTDVRSDEICRVINFPSIFTVSVSPTVKGSSNVILLSDTLAVGTDEVSVVIAFSISRTGENKISLALSSETLTLMPFIPASCRALSIEVRATCI